MNKKLLASLLLVIVLIGVLLFWFQRDRASAPSIPDAPSGSQTKEPENAQDLPLAAEEVTITGKTVCLPPKNTSGPQTLECAIGIADDNGVNYTLNSDDPSQVWSIPGGSRVAITGRLQEADPTSKYNTAGTLHVQSIKQL